MKPLTKVNLIIAASVLVLLSVIYGTSQLIVLKGFLTLENDSLAQNASRVMDALNDDIATLGTLADDWATWDDTYAFMQGKAPDFIDKNLPDDAFTRLRVNLVLLVDTQGRIAFGKAIDLEASAPIPLPDGLEMYLRGHPEFVQFTAPDAERQGLIVISGVPLLVGLRPIVTSEGTGPINGTLVMGRFLNAAEIARIAAVTHLDVAVGLLAGTELPDDFQQARSMQNETSGLSVIAPDDEKIRAYRQMADIEGLPAVMLRVQTPREIYQSGRNTLQYFMLSLLIITLLFGLFLRQLAGKLMYSQAKKREMENHYRAVVEQSGEGIIQVDIQSLNLLDANPAFCRLLGYGLEEVPRLSLSDLREGTADASRSYVAEVVKARRHTTHEGQLKCKDGSWLAVETGAYVVSNDGNDVLSIVVRDITERKHAQERIHYLAHYDPVTNMPNRVLMRDRLQQNLAHAERNHCMVAVLFLDLDRFKVINDSLGHHAGDLLLQILGQRLTGCIRQGDTVSRQGGDEFVVVISEVRQLEVLKVITEKLLATVAEPIEIYGHEVTTTTSIGISLFPHDGMAVDSLMKNADMAMYQAKKQGGNNCQFYSSDMNDRSRERLNLENSLRHALERGELSLHYQPQIDIGTGKVFGMEALLRWRHPQLGDIPPTKFIPLAEETGLISAIGDWVLNEACAQMQTWRDQGFDGLRISVNISARQLQQKDLVNRVGAILDATGLAASMLDLELTESMLMENMQENVAVLQSLRQLGLVISIDDFGTGYSSLAYLQRLPIETLKIDRSFVRDITSQNSNAPIALAVIALAHSLGHKVIAEGVETKEQLEFMRNHGCDAVQGYYFSKPLTAASLTEYLHSQRGLARSTAPVLQVVGASQVESPKH